MWSKPLLCRFRQSEEIPQRQVSQGFAAFRLALPRIPTRHSQTRRDTNFAIPGYSVSAMIPRRRVKIKFFLSVVIYVVKAAFVPFLQSGKIQQTQAPQGFEAFRLAPSRIQPRHSQTRRDTSFAIPGYSASAIIPRRGEKSKAFSRCGHLCAVGLQYILDK